MSKNNKKTIQKSLKQQFKRASANLSHNVMNSQKAMILKSKSNSSQRCFNHQPSLRNKDLTRQQPTKNCRTLQRYFSSESGLWLFRALLASLCVIQILWMLASDTASTPRKSLLRQMQPQFSTYRHAKTYSIWRKMSLTNSLKEI